MAGKDASGANGDILTMPPNLVYDDVEGKPIETRSISWPPAPEGRNLMYPHIPGTKAWTERFPKSVEEMFPNPLWTPVAKNPTLQGFMMLPIAYHGSPHIFEKFDKTKIGTGEGAQAYGHGLYFSEKPSVAMEYKNKLSPGNLVHYENIPTYKLDKGKSIAVRELEGAIDSGFNMSDAMEYTRMRLKYFSKEGPQQADYKKALDVLDSIDPSKITRHSGALYKADILPPAERFLDWDKPLSQQADSVKSALSKVSIDDIGLSYEPISNQGKYLYGSDRGYWVLNKGGRIGRVKNEPKTLADLEEISIGNLMDAVNSVKTSEALAKAGIPGIRYLDQGSRQAGKGTYNYVVFNDKDVKILERK